MDMLQHLLCVGTGREITDSTSDAEEYFSDTCLAVRNSIPPEKHGSLCGYALRICKNFALSIFKTTNRQKRSAILIELGECVSDSLPDLEPDEIGHLIDSFTETLSKREAAIFVRRCNCSRRKRTSPPRSA